MGHRTIPQFCKEEGVSRYMADRLIADGDLAYFTLRSRKLIPNGAWEEYIQRKTVTPCQDEIMDQDLDGSKNAKSGISSGQKTGAAVSAALALSCVNRLKSNLQNGLEKDNEQTAHVIQGKFS